MRVQTSSFCRYSNYVALAHKQKTLPITSTVIQGETGPSSGFAHVYATRKKKFLDSQDWYHNVGSWKFVS